MLPIPHEVTKEMLKGIKGLEEDLAPQVPKYIIKLKYPDTFGRRYHPAFYCGGTADGGYWHSYRGYNYFHNEVEAYWEVTPIETFLDKYKKIGCCSQVPCWYFDECKHKSKSNCRCCWCDGNLKNGEELVWNSKTKSYDYVLPQKVG